MEWNGMIDDFHSGSDLFIIHVQHKPMNDDCCLRMGIVMHGQLSSQLLLIQHDAFVCWIESGE
jgi:hypothetical protein